MSTPQSGGALRADSNPSGSGARRRAGRNLDGSGPSLSPRVAAVLRDEKKNCVLTDQQRYPIVTEMLNVGIPARAACSFAFVCMQAALEWACDDLSEDDAVRLAQALTPSSTSLYRDTRTAAEVRKINVAAESDGQFAVLHDEGKHASGSSIAARFVYALLGGGSSSVPLGQQKSQKGHEAQTKTLWVMGKKVISDIGTFAFRVPIEVVDGAAMGFRPFGVEYGVRFIVRCAMHCQNTIAGYIQHGLGEQTKKDKSIYQLAFDAINLIRCALGIDEFFSHLANLLKERNPGLHVDVEELKRVFSVPFLPHETRWMSIERVCVWLCSARFRAHGMTAASMLTAMAEYLSEKLDVSWWVKKGTKKEQDGGLMVPTIYLEQRLRDNFMMAQCHLVACFHRHVTERWTLNSRKAFAHDALVIWLARQKEIKEMRVLGLRNSVVFRDLADFMKNVDLSTTTCSHADNEDAIWRAAEVWFVKADEFIDRECLRLQTSEAPLSLANPKLQRAFGKMIYAQLFDAGEDDQKEMEEDEEDFLLTEDCVGGGTRVTNLGPPSAIAAACDEAIRSSADIGRIRRNFFKEDEKEDLRQWQRFGFRGEAHGWLGRLLRLFRVTPFTNSQGEADVYTGRNLRTSGTTDEGASDMQIVKDNEKKRRAAVQRHELQAKGGGERRPQTYYGAGTSKAVIAADQQQRALPSEEQLAEAAFLARKRGNYTDGKQRQAQDAADLSTRGTKRSKLDAMRAEYVAADATNMGKLSYFLVSVTKAYKIKDCEELLAAYAKWKDAPLNLDGAKGRKWNRKAFSEGMVRRRRPYHLATPTSTYTDGLHVAGIQDCAPVHCHRRPPGFVG